MMLLDFTKLLKYDNIDILEYYIHGVRQTLLPYINSLTCSKLYSEMYASYNDTFHKMTQV